MVSVFSKTVSDLFAPFPSIRTSLFPSLFQRMGPILSLNGGSSLSTPPVPSALSTRMTRAGDAASTERLVWSRSSQVPANGEFGLLQDGTRARSISWAISMVVFISGFLRPPTTVKHEIKGGRRTISCFETVDFQLSLKSSRNVPDIRFTPQPDALAPQASKNSCHVTRTAHFVLDGRKAIASRQARTGRKKFPRLASGGFCWAARVTQHARARYSPVVTGRPSMAHCRR